MNWKHDFNRIATRVLRNLPHPWLRASRCLPPLASGNDPLTLLLVLRPKDFDMALWGAWSWMFHLKRRPSLVLLVDGSFSDQQRAEGVSLFPGATFATVWEVLGEPPSSREHWDGWLVHNTFARKLAAVLHFSERGPLLYSDADILVFSPPEEVEEAIELKRLVHLGEPYPHQSDPWISARLPSNPDSLINAGLMILPEHTLAPAEIRRLFDGWTFRENNWMTEQTLCSSLLKAGGSRRLDPERYRNSGEGALFWKRQLDYRKIILRHFPGPVRHRFYGEGIPWLLRQVAARESRPYSS